jgi:hypothetical protein
MCHSVKAQNIDEGGSNVVKSTNLRRNLQKAALGRQPIRQIRVQIILVLSRKSRVALVTFCSIARVIASVTVETGHSVAK